jgi:hypothetical protein
MKRHSNIRRIALLTTFGLLLCLGLPSPAIEVGWYPGMYLNPGDGVGLNQQKEPKMPGLVEMGPTGISLANGWQNEVVTFAQHTYDMVKTLNINTSAAVQSEYGNYTLGISFFDGHKFDANDVRFVFTKTRNFGMTLYPPSGFSSNFWNQVAQYPKLQGEALHSVLASTLGTHYVAGHESAAFISVIYTFHYASASTKQRFSLSTSYSYDSAAFSSFVSSFFASTNTSTTMSYEFYSTDPNQSPTNFNLGSTGNITSYQGFTNFLNQLEAYANAMNPSNAVITGYILNPIQTVPGYLSILGGYVPPPVEPADYSEFLQAFTALHVWQQRLEFRGPMSWLNAKGQQVISNNVVDVNNYLSNMQSIAINHFTTGAPLDVPPDVVAYLANLSDLRLPEIYVMDTWQWFDGVTTHHTVIGRVDCGIADLIAPIPFSSLSVTNGNSVATTPLDYDAWHFETNMLKTYSGGSRNTHLKALFSGEQWNCLTNSNPDVNGFFLVTERNNVAADYSVAIYDPITGAPVDQMPFLATRSGGCATPSQFASGVGVSVTSTPPPTNGVVGLAQPVTVQVANRSSLQVYGIKFSFALSNAFDFGGANGSQGYASFDASTRMVTYAVGPLSGGASARIDLQLIPLQAGVAVPGTPPVMGVASGLINSTPTTVVTFSPIASAQPIIALAPARSSILLDWWSDTDRLMIERSSALGSGVAWSPQTNGVIINGSHRFLTNPVSGQQGYFRLRSRARP